MKIQVNRNGLVAVDADARQVDVSDLHPDIELIYYDTARGRGIIQYLDDVLVSAQERDFEAEREAERYALANNLKLPEEPKYKPVQIPKPNREFNDFGLVQLWYERWEAAEPVPLPEPPPPDPRIVNIEQGFRAGTVGTIQPATIQELKDMTQAEYNAWFTANFTTAAQALGLLRRITLLIIRRLL